MSMNRAAIFSSIFLIVFSMLIIYFWKGIHTGNYLLQLFSLKFLFKDMMIGLIGSIPLLLLLVFLIVVGKANLPETKGSVDLVCFLRQKRMNLLTVSIVTVLGEELLFRGVLLIWINSIFPSLLSNITISLLFTALHYKDQYKGQPYLLLYLFVMSLLTGIVTLEQQTLWSAFTIHAVSNFVTSALIRTKVIRLQSEC
ncbi:CPBP family intramembrane glutamic endopeptidase [Cohnella faecalis]|uniref:CPBP family intramembrane metalloprotease n=1 Tax=Cohnella faecalis TaxID=2315694 RepID=A0A398CJA4_9BACL|nr:CPBP family intramembrane glutamic endopeptidase [Cohnella faecalis]RIE02400.1 CPBP family intramembrane metalloprotease [Cohnella faecalis]